MTPDELGFTQTQLEARLRQSLALREGRRRRFVVWRAIAYTALVLASLMVLGFGYATFAQDSPLDGESAFVVLVPTIRAEDFDLYEVEPLVGTEPALRDALFLSPLERFGVTAPDEVLRTLGRANGIATLIGCGLLAWLGLRLGTRRTNAWLLLMAVGTQPVLVALACSPASGPLGFLLVALGMFLGLRTSRAPAGVATHVAFTAVLAVACLAGVGLPLFALWCVSAARPGPLRRARLAISLPGLVLLAVALGFAPLESTLTRDAFGAFGDPIVVAGGILLGLLAAVRKAWGLPIAFVALGVGSLLHGWVFGTWGTRAWLPILPLAWLLAALLARRIDCWTPVRRFRPGAIALLVVALLHVEDAWRLARYLHETVHVHQARARFLAEDLQEGEVYVTWDASEFPFLRAASVDHRVWSKETESDLDLELREGLRAVARDSAVDDPDFRAWRARHAVPPARSRIDPTTFRQVFDPEARRLELGELSRTAPERLLLLEHRDP